MAATASNPTRRARRRRFYLARGVMVLWIGVAALASCQRFRDGVRTTRNIHHAEFADYDACMADGGSWVADAGTCLLAAAGQERPAGMR